LSLKAKSKDEAPMKYLASIILLVIAAALFLLLMGSEDAAKMQLGFFNMAPWLVFIYTIASLGLNQYKGASAIANIGGCSVMLIVMITCIVGACILHLFNLPGSVSGGRLLFGLAVVDNLLGFYCPWRWSRAK
jgi:hypothetical protein